MKLLCRKTHRHILSVWLFLGLSVPGFLQLPGGELHAQETKWIRVGALHNWYFSVGCEPEVARRGLVADQQDGLQWPAAFADQDMQAAKGMWIGAVNYNDAVANQQYSHKVVHVGPRGWDQNNETMPLEFKMIGRFDHPTVLVDGIPASTLDFDDIVDEIDPDQKADRVIVNKVRTSMGIEFTRKIYAFSQQYHNNYFIYEYTFKNTGIVDLNNRSNPQTIQDMWVLWQYRYAVCKEMGAYGKFIMPQSATWGENTVNDARGEDPAAGDPFRAQFSWHGRHSGARDNNNNAIDNIGAPNYRSDGRLTASQFVGLVTIHADVSATDKADDVFQPRTTQYIFSDAPETQPNFNNQYSPNNMSTEYLNLMSVGHPAVRHADLVGDGFADQVDPGAGGYSQGQGFGPWTLATGDSITIVMAEAAAGLDWDKRIEVGANWLNDENLVLPNGATAANRDEYKNAWVFTGRDSIFQTFNRAIANWNSGMDIPQPPPPPDLFEVTGGGDRIILEWSNSAESWPGLTGYRIYRALGRSDTTYQMIAEVPAGTSRFDDVTATRGQDYYYFITTVDNGANNNSPNLNPTGPLESSRFYTQTIEPARLKRPAGNALDAIRVVPNPYNVRAARTTTLGFGDERLAFFDIPAFCTIKIYTERGDLIREIEHTDGSGDEFWDLVTSSEQVVVSGVYIAYFEVTQDYSDPETGDLLYKKGDNAFRKFVIIR